MEIKFLDSDGNVIASKQYTSTRKRISRPKDPNRWVLGLTYEMAGTIEEFAEFIGNVVAINVDNVTYDVESFAISIQPVENKPDAVQLHIAKEL